MKSIKNLNEALERIQILCEQSGNKDPELEQYITQLWHENNELKQINQKLRVASSSRHAKQSMHSKLSDALRE